MNQDIEGSRAIELLDHRGIANRVISLGKEFSSSRWREIAVPPGASPELIALLRLLGEPFLTIAALSALCPTPQSLRQ
jgi:hypothetical protein